MGILSTPPRSGLLSRRGAVFAAVAALHLVALVAALHARGPVVAEEVAAPIQMAILQEDPPREAPPKLELPPPPAEIVVPRIDIPVIAIPESQAIVPPPVVAAVEPPQVVAPSPVVAQSAAPVMLDVDKVDYQRKLEPRYPRAAKQARLQGTVLVWVLIDEEGRPREVRVHRSSGYEVLDREGCEAVSRALFKPYREHGVPRSAQAIVPIEFTLGTRTVRRD